MSEDIVTTRPCTPGELGITNEEATIERPKTPAIIMDPILDELEIVVPPIIPPYEFADLFPSTRPPTPGASINSTD